MNYFIILNPTIKSLFPNSTRAKTITLLGVFSLISLLNSCSNYSSLAPSPAMSANYRSASLNRNSVSDAQRTIVKTGDLRMKATDIRATGERVETIVSEHGGFMTSLNERDDSTKNADYQIKVPAQHLITTMDQISSLGMVDYRRITVTDVTRDMIRQAARLKQLNARRSRLKSLYASTKSMEDKLKIEETLAKIEEEIFAMEVAMREMQKTARYSKLSLSIKRSKIRGPLGIVKDASTWSAKKLFTIRE